MVDPVMDGATLIVRFETKDFARWKGVYEKYSGERGARSVTIYREVDEPSRVTAIIEWDDAATARAYVGDVRTKARMMEAGVVGVPELRFVRRG